MNRLAFVDCETTGLDPDRHEIWELAIIVNDRQNDKRTEWEFQIPVDLTKADPMGLRVGRFYERRNALRPMPDKVSRVSRWRTNQAEKWLTDGADSIAEIVASLLDGAHIVGAVPSFDAAFLTRWLNAHGQAATWHYHLIDVEALAAGHLIGSFNAIQECGANPAADEPTREEATRAIPPWNSNDLSRAVGVDPDDYDRHTALGDARWAKAIYEAVMGTS